MWSRLKVATKWNCESSTETRDSTTASPLRWFTTRDLTRAQPNWHWMESPRSYSGQLSHCYSKVVTFGQRYINYERMIAAMWHTRWREKERERAFFFFLNPTMSSQPTNQSSVCCQFLHITCKVPPNCQSRSRFTRNLAHSPYQHSIKYESFASSFTALHKKLIWTYRSTINSCFPCCRRTGWWKWPPLGGDSFIRSP